MYKDYSQREIIKQAALDLDVDDTIRITCPYCNATHEQSMVVRRTAEGLHARCYRAKCSQPYTFITSLPSPDYLNKVKKRTFIPKYFTEELVDVPQDVAYYMNDMYEITYQELINNHIKYNKARNIVVMPIRDIRGYVIGEQSKALDLSSSAPKAISYFHNDVEKAHFVITPENRFCKTIVLVEDILSAIKVGRLLPTCALLSHQLTPDVANLLSTHFTTLIVMLDPDALTKAVGIKQQYSLFFRNFYVIQLSNDPKDTPFTVLKQILSEHILRS